MGVIFEIISEMNRKHVFPGGGMGRLLCYKKLRFSCIPLPPRKTFSEKMSRQKRKKKKSQGTEKESLPVTKAPETMTTLRFPLI